MPIREHPAQGTICTCDFDAGFRLPEMVKRRPVIVISPKIRARAGLCTVVALSTTAPRPRQPYHCEIRLAAPLPPPWSSETMWVKGDMIYAVGFHRLDLIRRGKDLGGKRAYLHKPVSKDQLTEVRKCVLSALGLVALTRHL
jgi:uncharacterized protein YifN (PemK superfamily)